MQGHAYSICRVWIVERDEELAIKPRTTQHHCCPTTSHRTPRDRTSMSTSQANIPNNGYLDANVRVRRPHARPDINHPRYQYYLLLPLLHQHLPAPNPAHPTPPLRVRLISRTIGIRPVAPSAPVPRTKLPILHSVKCGVAWRATPSLPPRLLGRMTAEIYSTQRPNECFLFQAEHSRAGRTWGVGRDASC
ncbi:hypothetical protein K505DRAFT_94137 [Melanomma pulvis-pyrius CBS 109.77]|uniref:Uncharacterized protein n=1 Tax=Melanomma pulvis-pyrius CBS 109.77 TaxID=1314802 RepID=A0A6A6XWJ7_9PLEO|nr:hypothetical protein K505DRAFT_94137 [Melanomma pulvis-pyrius CBS 109.77]